MGVEDANVLARHIEVIGDVPRERAAHGLVSVGEHLYIFGGTLSASAYAGEYTYAGVVR